MFAFILNGILFCWII